jgi:UDP-N-acetylmuramoyl-L-alanyl-D-glutamate--2,6-diaminopimelate ligase
MAYSISHKSITLQNIFPAVDFFIALEDVRLSEHVVGQLCLDSRQIQTGDTFVALVGEQSDARHFIDSAVEQGAALVLCGTTEVDFSLSYCGQVPVLSVPNLDAGLSEIAGVCFNQPAQHMNMVGVTGTNGKTTCSHWLAQLLVLLGQSSATIGTLGFGLQGKVLTETGMTTPDAIATQEILSRLHDEGAQNVVAEVSSHSLVLHRVSGVPFKIALVTNIGRDHLDFHGSIEEYVAAKKVLVTFESLEHVVLNFDDDFYHEFKTAAKTKQVTTFSLLNSQADFYAKNIEYLPQGVSFSLVSPDSEFNLELAVYGEYNIYNILSVVASAAALGFSVAEIASKLSGLTPISGRLEKIENTGDVDVIVDFAHTADALESVLAGIKCHAENNLWCVFGCGGDRDAGKRPLMAAAAERLADQIVVTSDNPRTENSDRIVQDITAGFSRIDAVTFISERASAIEYAVMNANAGDVILIAGKGHENHQIIGTEKLPFSDVACARLAVRKRQERAQ